MRKSDLYFTQTTPAANTRSIRRRRRPAPPGEIGAWTLLVLAVGLGVTWTAYLLIGQQVIDFLYTRENSWLTSTIMEGRASLPIEVYYRRSDEIMVQTTFELLVVSGAVLIILQNVLGAVVAAASTGLCLLLIFSCFELFPSLIETAHLNAVSPYHSFRANHVPDEDLVFREKPYNSKVFHEFRGSHYSPLYEIEIPPATVDWSMDKYGFRNSGAEETADVLVIGDSYVEYGDNNAETLTARLDEKLPDLRVRNLGKSAYGPFQYLEVLKRFGLQAEPRYAVFAFYEGNDIGDIKNYLLWKGGRAREVRAHHYRFVSESFFHRLNAAFSALGLQIKKTTSPLRDLLLNEMAELRGYDRKIHPDVALLDLGGGQSRKLFVDRLSQMPAHEMLLTDEFLQLKNILAEFRDLCQQNDITPIIFYIPAAVHIYAPYSINASGRHWLAIRDGQVAASENTEEAVTNLAHELDIEFASLTPTLQDLARQGKMLYYPLDAHWNREGTEIAARFLAGVIRSREVSRGS